MHINKKIHIFSGEREISGENGFTLIEVLIAVSIFAIGLLAIAALQISTAHGNRVGDQLTKATMLAQMQVETLKNAGFNSAILKGDGANALVATANYVDPNNPIDENGVNGGRFTRTWTITNNTAFSRLVTVNVAWDGGGRNVVMSTLTRGGGI
ncbi:MAG: prepilin-type N-terminal cleavage/methylation domain-containing protein [Proteobacteria bacterium]|nr:prepilin-type N-terminal cleavage/methylation domain-containing protein [Pseudomonadota bacterium]MBU4009718.1 prepilin-type N-terminal cleavage/methylation domain-containing protein [Pseudomonadota bacterium]MBU4037811.1 prepilin-type N-terminal cleavage/methylation domain-containing protein [Pseudomonadota bacterium]